jgi:heme exporter protein A
MPVCAGGKSPYPRRPSWLFSGLSSSDTARRTFRGTVNVIQDAKTLRACVVRASCISRPDLIRTRLPRELVSFFVTLRPSRATLGPMAFDFDRVEVCGLVRVFGVTRAVDGVDASFKAGTLTTVEGPNGSGKSTLLSMLGLVIRPTRGQIRFGDRETVQGEMLRARIGMLAHSAMVYSDLTGIENLNLFARLYGVASPEQRAEQLRDRFEIGNWCERPTRTYSRGQLQRVALARALLHRPRLLLLDEPSAGLDSAAIERLVTALIEERQRGAIAVMATHDRALAERLGDVRLQMRQGRLEEQA